MKAAFRILALAALTASALAQEPAQMTRPANSATKATLISYIDNLEAWKKYLSAELKAAKTDSASIAEILSLSKAIKTDTGKLVAEPAPAPLPQPEPTPTPAPGTFACRASAEGDPATWTWIADGQIVAGQNLATITLAQQPRELTAIATNAKGTAQTTIRLP
jgi:hypothetical protein